MESNKAFITILIVFVLLVLAYFVYTENYHQQVQDYIQTQGQNE